MEYDDGGGPDDGTGRARGQNATCLRAWPGRRWIQRRRWRDTTNKEAEEEAGADGRFHHHVAWRGAGTSRRPMGGTRQSMQPHARRGAARTRPPLPTLPCSLSRSIPPPPNQSRHAHSARLLQFPASIMHALQAAGGADHLLTSDDPSPPHRATVLAPRPCWWCPVLSCCCPLHVLPVRRR